MAHTKVTNGEMNMIDRIVLKNRAIKAKSIKQSLKLKPSVRTVQKYLNILGWRKIRTKFCQMVSVKNRIERYIYASLCLSSHETFNESIFIDESTVQLNKNANRIWYKFIYGETRLGLIGKNKHEPSVHIIGGISRSGPTKLVIFEGKLNARGFQRVSRIFLLPFIAQNYPLHHRLHMDNAPTHSANTTKNFLIQNGVNHFKTPAQSPDLMPIELVWNDLKRYLADELRPNNKHELINGILKFWSTKVTIDYCVSKIDHVQRVLSQIILLEGKATGM
jgi:hypothetical protein